MELSVNVDHVATVREARGGTQPDPVYAAMVAELAGASGIVCHLREDRRHINDRDVRLLREVVKTRLNLEMAATEDMVSIARELLPDLVTLVPERRQERTTEGGLNVVDQRHYLRTVVDVLHEAEIQVSVFVEPVLEQVEAAADIGADIVELHTGHYANATTSKTAQQELHRLQNAAEFARTLGLHIAAGHGLTYDNILPICRVHAIQDVSIGHAIVARALYVGFEQAVRQMVELIRYGRLLPPLGLR
ncbi:MAG: pyridoxine 5'-phosphate synthase [Candidatus Kapabacteria bacterium]|nr:pyridoxine 5'-phosphate synthase [Candidatus Kapabacteria bacterium]MCS7169777.1 pyridoxine 5'-phosphate synthase [Candidatus Kapabacteria bacterium]MDW7997650.1 pyridoxine 5'-phosphate synthase [Bacteroidota bacterium]MDW8224803.1 pyridoxine 5'-phosphate synthase [Bacteroidota bacterium]